MNKELRKFAMLARILFFPARWVEWLFWIGQVVSIIFFLVFKSKAVLVFWACSVFIPFVFGFLFCSQQVLTLISGRQLGLIQELKPRIFLFLIFIPAVAAAWSGIFGYLADMPIIPTALMVYFWASVFLSLSVYLRELGTVVPLVMVFVSRWSELSYSQLVNINPFILPVVSVGIWVVFYLWWSQWRPEKFYREILSGIISGQRTKSNNTGALWVGYKGLRWFRSIKLVEALLSNGVDITKGQFSFYALIICALTASVLSSHYLAHKNFIDSLVPFGYFPFLLLLFFSASPALLFCINVHKTWLHFIGNREEHFQYIERGVWKHLSINALAAIGYSFFLYNLIEENIWVLINLTAAIIVFSSILFYSHVYDFHKNSGYGRTSFYVTTLMILAFAGLLVFVGVVISVNGASPALLIKAAIGNIGLFISMLIMRQRLMSLWLHVDFVRSAKG